MFCLLVLRQFVSVCADALHEKLEDMAWIDEQPWEESLLVTAAAPTQVQDVDDDLERELAFYNQVWRGACHLLLCICSQQSTH